MPVFEEFGAFKTSFVLIACMSDTLVLSEIMSRSSLFPYSHSNFQSDVSHISLFTYHED